MPIRVHLRCLVLALLATACVTIPPPVMPLEGASREPVGSTSVRLYGVYGDDLLDRSVALGGRVTRQLNTRFSVGGEAIYGRVLKREPTLLTFGGRGQLKFNPGTDYFAVSGGVGVLRTQNLSAFYKDSGDWSAWTVLSGDLGLRASTGRNFVVEPYVGLNLSWEQFLSKDGAAKETEAAGIGYVIANVGMVYRPRSRLSFGADLGVILATFTDTGFNRKMKRPIYLPTLSVAYRFGGEEAK